MKKLRNFALILTAISIFIITCISITYSTGQHLKAAENNTTTGAEYNYVKKISLGNSSMSITKGKKSAIKATIKYGKNDELKNEPITWKSKNPKIATVNKKGIIKAVSTGSTYIICSSISGQVKVRCKIIVRAPFNKVKSIKLYSTQIRLNKKDKRTVKTKITYGKDTKYSNEPLVWSSQNNKIASVKNGVIKGKKNGITYVKVKSKYTNKTARIKVIVKKTKYIAFTFDDGPGDYTNKLLDALEKFNSKATFFVLGNRANQYKNQLKREYNLGMEIGSHTYSHKNLNTLSKKSIISEITKAKNIIKNITGEYPTLLRPPYGNFNKTVSSNAGVPMIYWSVDTEDWKYKNTNYVSNYIIKHSYDGALVLLHDIHSTSVSGFIKALPKLKKKGYELVTVSELYSIKGKKLAKGIMHYGPNSKH